MFLGKSKVFKQVFFSKRFFNTVQTLMKEMVDPLELVTGKQKKELDAYMQGNCDPFHVKPIKRGPGTCDNPTLIPSAFEARLVGCICKDNRFINFMWVEKDIPKRCDCGHWYKLKPIEPI